jgi:hypothetical protein
MKSDGWQLRIIALAIAASFIVAAKVHSQPFPLLTMSNAIPTNSPALSNSEPVSETNETVPVIEMRGGVPMSTVIQNLARQANINYIIDARLIKWWSMPDSDGDLTHEPTLTFRWENLTARQGLVRLLKEHNLVLLEDPITSIARITYINQVVNPIDVSLFGNDTNLIPMIEFEEVPITTALVNLVRQAGLNYAFDPKIGYGLPDKNGQVKIEPTLNIYWRNVTAKQAFVAICQNYDFIIAKNPATSILLIREKSHPVTNFVDASLLGSDTNIIPVIQFQNVPLNTGLGNLAKQIHYDNNTEIALDPSIDNVPSNKFSPMPTLALRWENVTAKQAIVALCDNYDLIIVKNSEMGVIQIRPKD